MKITDITLELQPKPEITPYRWREGLPADEVNGEAGILRLHTEDGVVGVAHTNRGVIARDVVQRVLAPQLVGRDATLREDIWHRLWELDRVEEFPIYAFGLVDVALWDAWGKRAGQPVWQLMGGARTEIDAYASTVTYGSIAEFLDVIDQLLDRGFRAIKLHAFGDVDQDIALCTAVRERVGPGFPLMYDGSAGFALHDAVRLGRALAELDYRWYEEPMREFNVHAYRRLAELVDVPLLVGETVDGAHYSTADFIAGNTATAVRTSPRYRGGLTGALRVAHLADAFSMNAEVHGSGILQRHLCMAVRNNSFYECLIRGNPISVDPVITPQGTVLAPTAPGVGE